MSYTKLSVEATALMQYPSVRGAIEELKKSKGYEERACLDNYHQFNKLQQIVAELNRYYEEFEFKLEEVFGGYGTDLVIVDKCRKAEYDKIPKTHTVAEVEAYLKTNFGIQNVCCSSKENQLLTEAEYQGRIELGRAMKEIFDDNFSNKNE